MFLSRSEPPFTESPSLKVRMAVSMLSAYAHLPYGKTYEIKTNNNTYAFLVSSSVEPNGIRTSLYVYMGISGSGGEWDKQDTVDLVVTGRWDSLMVDCFILQEGYTLFPLEIG